MVDLNNIIVCPDCGQSFDKEDLTRSCGNCFACIGCEIYNCPNCRASIVVKPMKERIVKKVDKE
jgi:hypothetical protein